MTALTYADLSNPSDWLHGADLKGREVTMTISGVDVANFGEDGGKAKVQGVLTFQERPKTLGLNKTNRECIRAMFGPDDPNEPVHPLWIGKRITMFPSAERNPSTKKVEPAVRIKGSPDISAPITFTLILNSRTRPREVTLVPTGRQGQGQ